MKVSREKLGRWLNNPVTKAYVESLTRLNNEVANHVASGGCISESMSVDSLYNRYLGKLEGLQAAIRLEQCLNDFGLIEESEATEEEAK